MFSRYAHCGFSPLARQGVAFGPLAPAMAVAAPYLMAASAGMTILGGISQANAQRAAGETAYQNALQRNAMAQQVAQQQEAAATAEVAAGQRQDIEAKRKGMLMASRATAVMAASGAGIDKKLVASLIGEGDYAGSVAEYNAGEKARALDNQAKMTRYSGQAGIWSGGNDKAALDTRASNTLVSTIGGAGLSLASKYGDPKPGSEGIDSEIASWSQYGQDPASQAALKSVLA